MKKTFLTTLGAGLMTLGVNPDAAAQNYPTHAIARVLPYAAGGGAMIGSSTCLGLISQILQILTIKNRLSSLEKRLE